MRNDKRDTILVYLDDILSVIRAQMFCGNGFFYRKMLK